ncbi:type II toxin-antitoxin system ParD family antitoxin [Mesorhizobium sp. WSM4906]|uniref:type II toxin-antitoxin system ParD family antitoxin n=1 Tax=Mesorhizobium sp. WSM4906 TaxID=3038546 RepID=UPI002417AB57|nr:type II toxin-antitoxin system ParD family antitoxin [Mesorhizobium sp. WSM4906]WFP75362.1 type II toxin-antitoxin system ParD family antitoxin [Mesorhizobium sp. WSM4906]
MKSQTMRTLTISLTPKQAARLQDAVDSGGYASNSEIVREALRLWEHREELRALELAQLKQAYEEGMASGEGQEVDRAAFLRALKAERAGRG